MTVFGLAKKTALWGKPLKIGAFWGAGAAGAVTGAAVEGSAGWSRRLGVVVEAVELVAG